MTILIIIISVRWLFSQLLIMNSPCTTLHNFKAFHLLLFLWKNFQVISSSKRYLSSQLTFVSVLTSCACFNNFVVERSVYNHFEICLHRVLNGPDIIFHRWVTFTAFEICIIVNIHLVSCLILATSAAAGCNICYWYNKINEMKWNDASHNVLLTMSQPSEHTIPAMAENLEASV